MENLFTARTLHVSLFLFSVICIIAMIDPVCIYWVLRRTGPVPDQIIQAMIEYPKTGAWCPVHMLLINHQLL